MLKLLQTVFTEKLWPSPTATCEQRSCILSNSEEELLL